MATYDDARSRLAQRGTLLLALLRREERGLRGRILLWGGLHVLAALALVGVVLVAIASATPALPRAAGLLLAALAWGLVVATAWRHWVQPLGAIPNLAVFARRVEERHDFRDLLRAALEFSQRGPPEGESLDLVAATVDRAYEEASALRLTRLFEFAHRRRDGVVALAGAAMIALLASVAPDAPGHALRGLAFRWPTPGDILYGPLEVLSADPQALAGQAVEVAVREHGPRAPELVLRFDDTGDLWKSRRLEPREASKSEGTTAAGRAPEAGGPASYRDYVFRFEDVRTNLAYRFESGRRRTEEHRIRVVQRPIVGRLQLRLVPPSYTGRPPSALEVGRGDAVALAGTRVEIEGAASSPLASAHLVPDGGPAGAVTLPSPLHLQLAGKTFRGGFVLRGDLRYHFDLVDSLGNPNTDPVAYQLSAVEDQPPYVEVRVPGRDADLPKTLRVPLAVYAADDFGLSRLTLAYRHEREGEDIGGSWLQRQLELRGAGSSDADGRPLAAGPVPEVLLGFEWSLEDLGLYPGDWVSYYVEAEDNDDFSGHKTARSSTYRLRLPTLAEMYADIQAGDANRKSQLDDAIDKSKQLQQKYDKLARELKKNPDMDWQKQKEIETTLEKQKQLADQVQKIAEDLQKEVQKMQEQQVVSQEITQKLDEIRKLMEQVQDETLRQYMQRLQEAMKQVSPEEIQRAMEKMEMSQAEFLKRLERTKSLLEQLQREQKLDQMIERVSELLQQQEQLGEKTDRLEDDEAAKSPEQEQAADRLAEEQSELGDETSELQEDLDQLAQESNQAGQPQLEDANQQVQEQNPAGEMQEASKGLQEKQPSQAQPHQQKAEKSLRSLYQQLMNAQQSMSMSAQAEAAEKLQKAARQVLDVSFRQEGVSKEPPPGPGAARQGELAQRQQALVSATGKVVQDLDALAQQSLAAPPQVPALLGEAMTRMQEGVRSFERGNPADGRAQGEEAYGLLNRAVVELSRSASSSCSRPGSGQGASQRMDELMGRQQQLNDLTRQLKERLQNPSNPTPEERAEMSRLLGEQQAIQQQLDDVERQAREARELLGRLDKMQDEMHEVVQDMESEHLTDETLRVQEQIVSRMLDAQRSLHKRDYNEKRESRTAADIFSKGGQPTPESARLKKLRRDIDRALREGTPEEYEDLVREYFRAISEAEGAVPPDTAPVP